MAFLDRSAIIAVLGLGLATGCGNNSGSEGSDSNGDSSGSTSESTESEAGDGESTTNEEEESESESGETETGDPTEVNLSGIVQDFFVMGPIEGAEITVVDLPEYDQTTAADGAWSFPGMEPNTDEVVVIADSEDYWGAVIPFPTGDEDDDSRDLAQVSNDVINIQEALLQEQDDTVVVDREKGAIIVRVIQNTATGTMITVDPPLPENTYYSVDPDGVVKLNDTLIEWQLYPVAVFFNLDDTPGGEYTFSASHPERDCTIQFPEPEVRGRHITLVDVDCPPPG